jgi:hypothetical protein
MAFAVLSGRWCWTILSPFFEGGFSVEAVRIVQSKGVTNIAAAPTAYRLMMAAAMRLARLRPSLRELNQPRIGPRIDRTDRSPLEREHVKLRRSPTRRLIGPRARLTSSGVARLPDCLGERAQPRHDRGVARQRLKLGHDEREGGDEGREGDRRLSDEPNSIFLSMNAGAIMSAGMIWIIQL